MKIQTFSMTAACAALVSLSAFAWEPYKDSRGVTWHYNVDSNGEVYLGTGMWNGYNAMAAVDYSTAGDLAVPSEIEGKPVVRLADYAFAGCSKVTSVAVPASVREIGKNAFWDAKAMTNVTIKGAGLVTIGENAFESAESLAAIRLPESVKEIGQRAFYGCSSLKSANIPGSVQTLQDGTFESCPALESVELGEGIETIKAGAFWWCKSLAEISIPESVRSVGGAFSGCADAIFDKETIPGVTLVDGWAVGFDAGALPYDLDLAGVRGVAGSAFEGANGLRSVAVPDGAKSVGAFAFASCANLKSVSLGADVEKIGDGAFSYCTSLETVSMPDAVKSIGEKAFENCSKLRGFDLPSSLREIGGCAFYGCRLLTKAIIPEGVVFIGYNAFYDCSSITEVSLPDGLETLEHEVFTGCANSVFDKETVPGVTFVDGWAVDAERNIEGTVDLKSARGIANYLFCNNYCGKFTGVVLPPDLKRIGECVFCTAASLASVDIPDSVAYIGDGAFSGCKALSSVKLPAALETIDEKAFESCESLTELTVPPGVTNISEYAFESCTSLVKVKLPKFFKGKLTTSSSQFSGCNYNLELVFYSTGGACTVSFDPNGGEILAADAERQVSEGDAIGELPVPSRDGFIFAGWFTAPKGGEAVGVDCVVEEDVTFYARWTAAWSVTFAANGGYFANEKDEDDKSLTSQKSMVAKGKTVGALPTPKRTGYKFAGWYTAKTKGTKITASTKVTKNVTYYARWTVNKYKVAAAVNSKTMGAVSGAGSKAFNSKVTLKATPKKGYVFVRWENVNDPETPWPNALKYRQPSATFTMGAKTVSVRAVFAKAASDVAPALTVESDEDWYVEDAPERTIAVAVDSLSYPAVTLSGAPTGVALVRAADTDCEYTLQVADAAKMKPGVYTAKITAKNRAAKSVAKTVRIVAPNSSAAVEAGLIAGLEQSTLSPYVAPGGMKTNWTLADLGVETFATNGWKLAAITGLPSGLSWNGTAITGAASKTGLFTATFKFTKTVKTTKTVKGKKTTVTETLVSTATAMFAVESLEPASIAGTYNGCTFAMPAIEESGDESGADGDNSEAAPVKPIAKATVTVSAAGKISANIGGVALTATGFDAVSSNGVFGVTLRKTQKITSGKLKNGRKVWEAYLEFDSTAPWDEESLAGIYSVWSEDKNGNATGSTVYSLVAQQARFSGTTAELEAVAVAKAVAGTRKFALKSASGGAWAYDLVAGGTAFSAVAKANGAVTVSGKIGKTKISGSGVLEIGGETNESRIDTETGEERPVAIRTATARIFSGAYAVEIVYTLEDGAFASATGRIWKK